MDEPIDIAFSASASMIGCDYGIVLGLLQVNQPYAEDEGLKRRTH